MICQQDNKWVLIDDATGLVVREALAREKPPSESTVNSPERIKARYEDSLRKTNVLKAVCDDLFVGHSAMGQLDEIEEEKILIGLKESMAVLVGEVRELKILLTTPKPSLWERIKSCL